MKKCIVWPVVSCLMVAGLLLASCAPTTAPTPTPTTTPTQTPTQTPTPTPGKEMVKDSLGRLVEKPRYGGVYINAERVDPTGFDELYVGAAGAFTLRFTHDLFSEGQWIKGQSGTGEFQFVYNLWYGQGPCLVESWEIPDADTFILHVRKGVHWALNPKSEASRLVGGRELTSEDIAAAIQRNFATPTSVMYRNFAGWLQSTTTPDKYTLVVKGKDSEAQRTAQVYEYLFSKISVVPPEVVAKYGSVRDWSNSVGTGPFMMTDYVPSSSVSFVRNPNYWDKDPLHPENQLPYLDGAKVLIIPDKSTLYAALRTGKIDHAEEILKEDADGLKSTNPEIKWAQSLLSYGYVLWMRVDKPELPIYDIRVRQALHLAIDFESIKNDYYGGAEIMWYPVMPAWKADYIPLSELPKSISELYEHNPDKAKQLLAEAGYPKGFKTKALTSRVAIDEVSILKAYMAEIGVDMEIQTVEPTVFTTMSRAHTYEQMMVMNENPGLYYSLAGVIPGDVTNWSRVEDPYFTQARARLWMWDLMGKPERSQVLKESTLRQLGLTLSIAFPNPYAYTAWQPWVNHYGGERSIGRDMAGRAVKWIWYDQDLKESMTGMR